MKHLDDEGLLYTARNTNQNFVGHVTLIMQMQCAFVADDDGLWQCNSIQAIIDLVDGWARLKDSGMYSSNCSWFGQI